MIYFIRAGEFGHVKIGWTADRQTLNGRLTSLQTGQPHRLKIIRTIEDAPRWSETWFHGVFAKTRMIGEWFEYSPEMLTIRPPLENPAQPTFVEGRSGSMNWLRASIKALGCSQRGFGEHVGLREETVSRMLHGTCPISRRLEMLVREWLGPSPVNPPQRHNRNWLPPTIDTPPRAAGALMKVRPLVEDCVTTEDPRSVPKHDLAAQIRTLGADSLLPDRAAAPVGSLLKSGKAGGKR